MARAFPIDTGSMFTSADHQFMNQAVRLAARGLYSTDPNPRVGCVLVRDGAVVGTGWHGRAGQPHAEVFALREAGERARGATAYVTLEPCCHHGRTPPCSEALIAAGVTRVVVAMADPTPLVAGRGMAQLAAAGMTVQSGLLAADAAALNPGFISRMQRGRPWLRVKSAMSLDGRSALANGVSQWITGEAARQDVQHWRARSSAILTGIGTLLADDPALNVRLPPAEWNEQGDGEIRQPLRVVADSRLRLPAAARVLQVAGATQVFTCSEDIVRAALLREAGATVSVVPPGAGGVDLAALLLTLGAQGINEVWVEAGPGLSGVLLAQGWVDELVIYMAPKLLGDTARGLFHLPQWASLSECLSLNITDVRAVGADWRIMAQINNQTATAQD